MPFRIGLADWYQRYSCGHNQTNCIAWRQVSTVGRVQTPTLSLVIDRELEIRQFVPKTFYKISAEFSLSEGNYSGFLQKGRFSKGNSDKHDRIDRLWDQNEANSILAEIQCQNDAEVTETKKEVTAKLK